MQAPKRRRVEVDPRGGYSTPDASIYNNQRNSEQYLRNISNYHSGNDIDPAASSAFSISGSSAFLSGQIGSTAALTSKSTSSQQWEAQSYGFPDAAAYTRQQQPYFSGYSPQSTDPSTYNSPWPPPAQRESFEDQSSNYGPTSSNAMPYFGRSNTGSVDANASFDGAVTTSLQGYGHDIDMSADYLYGNQEVHAVSLPADDSSATVFDDASMQLKNQSLPILDNLAIQLIQTTAKVSLPQIQEILNGSDTEEGQAYSALRSLFEQTRKVYSRETPFIDAMAIQMFQPNQQEIIRKANIATFISSILGAHAVKFSHLNEFFIETFVPLGHRLLKWQGAIYLELKTQAYISALMNSDRNPSAMLDELFPADLDEQILTRHPDTPSLSPSEQDFIGRCRARKSYLLDEGNASTALKELPKRYQWNEFVRECAGYISKNVEAIISTSNRAQNTCSSSERRNTLTNDRTPIYRPTPAAGKPSTTNQVNKDSTSPRRPTLPTSTSAGPSASGASPRQPWTKAEEDALLSGLARVNGPHWSQILALYGRGGSVSEVLKDRNQVQLKDKARNLKLAYLKVGREVPEALRGVTGELKTRGGKSARAAILDGDEQEEGGPADSAAAIVANGRTEKGKTKKGS